MSVNPLLMPVRKDIDTIRKTVLTNIVKMICNRKWLLEENLNKTIDEVVSIQNDDQIYKIKLDVNLGSFDTYDPPDDTTVKKNVNFEDNIVMIKLLPQKITSVGKSPIIGEFFDKYKKFHKILVVEGISEKSKQQIISNKHTEVFNESFFMLDLLEHVCSPKYEILSPTESKEMLESYHLLKKKMKRMFESDPASYYLYLKKKQIVRIIRNSELTGGSIDYRIVVPHKNA